jgi:hypothetical protein
VGSKQGAVRAGGSAVDWNLRYLSLRCERWWAKNSAPVRCSAHNDNGERRERNFSLPVLVGDQDFHFITSFPYVKRDYYH